MSDFQSAFICSRRGRTDGPTFQAINPSSGEPFGDAFAITPSEEIETVANLAATAAPILAQTSGPDRAAFLRLAADKIAAQVAALKQLAPHETGLPEARIQGETGRTVGQLRLFASLIEDGSWVDARIDTAQPDREPLPKPDCRSMLRPVGPVEQDLKICSRTLKDLWVEG